MKRKKNESPEPIHCLAKIGTDPHYIWVQPEELYQALQPTLARDHLEWKTKATQHPEELGYYIPARILLDLARLWRDEKYAVKFEVDTVSACLIIHSNFNDVTGRYTSKTTLKLNVIEELPDWREGIPLWADRYKDTFIPFALVEKLPEIKAQTADPWIAKACSKDEARPTLTRSWGDFAADGYRLHYDPRLEPTKREDLPEWCPPHEIEELRKSIQEIRSHPATNVFSVDSRALARAVKAAKAVNKDIIALGVNGRLDVSANGEELGQAGQYLTDKHSYQHAGPDLEVGINPRFLLDALTGFKGEIVISLGGADGTAAVAPITLTDGVREAVIMPKHLGPVE